MSQPPPARPAPFGRDPLRAFRERAAVILAEERGLTPQCRIKLARVARELGLSDAQSEEGIRSLSKSAAARRTDPILEKFRERLRKDLSGRQKTVIGPEIETRVIESAKRKYGLEPAAVRDVLAAVAAELGLRHITGDEAVGLFADVVDQAVGDATWVAREAWDRLRSSGEKWGLSYEEADDLIQQKVAANRRARAARGFWNQFVLGGSLAGVALAAGVLGVMYYRSRERPDVSPTSDAGSSVAPREAPVKAPSQPAWWDVDLAVAMSTARREISRVAEIDNDLRSTEGGVRQKAYDALVELATALEAGSRQRELVVQLLAGCHALDPDEACAESLRRELLALVPDSGRELTRSSALYERAYFGVETAMVLLARQGMPAPRAAALAAAISSAVGVSVAADGQESDESLHSALAALTRRLYGHLTAQGPAQPEQAAGLQSYLAAQAHVRLPPEEVDRLNAAFVVAMITGAEQAWKTFEPLLVQLSQSRDPLIVLDLLSAYRKIENRELQQALGALLVRRTGAKPRGDDPRQVARAVRQALGAAGVSIAQSAEDRWEDLLAAAEPVLGRRAASAGDREAVLAETVEMARLATAALALAQGEPGFAIFDELSRAADEEAGAGASATEDESPAKGGFTPPPRPKRAMSQHDRQVLTRSIAQLADYQQQPPVARSNALRIIAARVPMAQDLSYEQATIVARYLLAAKEDDELESALGAIEQLGSWMQVRLAVADQLEESRLTRRQLATVLEGLLGSLEVSAEGSPATLRRKILQSVLADLDSQSHEQPLAPARGRQALEELTEPYRQRARALALPAAEYQAASSPAAMLQIVVAALVQRRGEAKPAENRPLLVHELEAVNYLAEGDAQRTVLLQRLLIDALARRIAVGKPQAKAAAAKIRTDLAAADAAAEDLLLQLRSGERATLEMGMLYAQP